MNAISLDFAELPDPALLDRCLKGERDAFGQLVLRYQGIVCAQAYAVCGDLSRSEDVAQEAFVNAWRKLGSLRDHSKFKSWLCGIARHLALRITEERTREQKGTAIQGEVSPGATPHEAMASREEEALVWEALEALPEAYRSALVLYYRENKSVFEVARALDLSEDAVKQRLSRGRAMLRQQIAQVVELVLARTRPGPTFAAGVLAAIGASIPATSTAATVAAAAAKGAGSATAGISLPVIGTLLGGGIGIMGAWLGVRMSAEDATYEREREAILKKGRYIAKCIVVFILLQFGTVFLAMGVFHNVPLLVGSIMGLTLAYMLWILWESRRGRLELQRIRDEEIAKGSPQREQRTGAWRHLSFYAAREYRSRLSLFGWPLVHIARGGPSLSPSEQTIAKGWIAIGERAVGLIAVGGVAIGGIAFGGLAIGGFAFGGLGLGVLALGGCVCAGWAYGGVAVGWISFGGMAIASKLALGGFALSHAFAVGAYALAPHVNDAAAQAVAAESTWIQMASWPWFPIIVPLTVVLVFGGVGLLHARMRPSGDRAAVRGL